MKRTKSFLIAIALSIGLSSSMAFAHGPGGPGGPGGGMAMPMILHSLNLTADQKSQIHQIMKSQRPTLKPLFEQLHQGHEQLETELFSTGQITMANLTPIEQNNEKIQAQIQDIFLQTALQIRGVLTQGQISQGAVTLAKLQDLQSQMHTLMSPDDNGDEPPPPPDAQ